MALVALKCPNCGGSLDLEDSREFAFCQFCGTKIMIQDEMKKQKVEIDDTKKISGWIDSAKLFLERGMPDECYRYASMATDADPCNALAWYYRAESTPHGNEKLVAATRALELISDDDPLRSELVRLKDAASNMIKITIINELGSAPANSPISIYFDGKLVNSNGGTVASFDVPGGRYEIKTKGPMGWNKSSFISKYNDVIINVTYNNWGIVFREFEDSSDKKTCSSGPQNIPVVQKPVCIKVLTPKDYIHKEDKFDHFEFRSHHSELGAVETMMLPPGHQTMTFVEVTKKGRIGTNKHKYQLLFDVEKDASYTISIEDSNYVIKKD